MGDRAVVLFEDDNEIQGYAVYFHWAGQEGVESLYQKTLEYMGDCADDVPYFAARFVGLAHAEMDGQTGLGMLAPPTLEEFADPAAMAKYSHGDAGVCVLSPATKAIRWIEGTGYGASK
mgnify:FL=1